MLPLEVMHKHMSSWIIAIWMKKHTGDHGFPSLSYTFGYLPYRSYDTTTSLNSWTIRPASPGEDQVSG